MDGADCGTCSDTSSLQVVVPENKSIDLTISDKAQHMLKGAMAGNEGSGLLVNILSGGCSGYKYDLQIIEPPADDSYVIMDVDGICVFVPRSATGLLDGIEIDYEDRLMGGGFKIENPNANRNCGCGESFG